MILRRRFNRGKQISLRNNSTPSVEYQTSEFYAFRSVFRYISHILHFSELKLILKIDVREDSDNQNSEKTPLSSRIQTVSPSVMCSPGIGRSFMEERMNFSMNMWKPPRLMSAAIKKKSLENRGKKRMDYSFFPWRKCESDPEFTGEKVTSLDIYCIRRETIFLCRLLLNSHFSDCFLTILTENALNLRRPGDAVLKLRSALKILDRRDCLDLPGSLLSLGVHQSSGCNFGGWVIISEIGSKNKKDFLVATGWTEFL